MRQAKDDSEIPGTVAYEAASADRLQARIAALEAALREIAYAPEGGVGPTLGESVQIARAALEPEQDK